MGRRRGNIIEVVTSGVLTGTSKAVAVTGARAGDFVFITPANASAAALVGTVTGVFAVASSETVTLTYPTAAGTEVFNLLVVPRSLSDNA